MSSYSNDSYQDNDNERRAQLVIKLKDIPETEKLIFTRLLSGNYNEAYDNVFQSYKDIKYDLRGMYHIGYYLKDYSSFTDDQVIDFITQLKNEREQKYPNDSLEVGFYNVINTSDVQVTYTFLDKLFGYEVNINTTSNLLKPKTKGRKTPATLSEPEDDVSLVSSSSNNNSIYYRESVSNIRKRNRKPIIAKNIGYNPNEILAKLNEQKQTQGDSSPESSSIYSSSTETNSPKHKLAKTESILLSSIYNYTLANQSYTSSIYDMDIDVIIDEAKEQHANEETIKNLYQQRRDTQKTIQSISSPYKGGYYKTRKRNRKKRKNKSKKYYKKK